MSLVFNIVAECLWEVSYLRQGNVGQILSWIWFKGVSHPWIGLLHLVICATHIYEAKDFQPDFLHFF